MKMTVISVPQKIRTYVFRFILFLPFFRVTTLLPGDILLTGTPGGVGMYRSPPEYLKPGDVIHSEIQNIGVLETKLEKF